MRVECLWFGAVTTMQNLNSGAFGSRLTADRNLIRIAAVLSAATACR